MRGRKYGAKTKRNLLTDQEIEDLINACNTAIEKLVIKGLLYTGMRVSEFIHMRRDWIDWDSGFIRIPESQECTDHSECRKERTVVDWGTGEKIKIRNTWRPKVQDASRVIPILPEVKGIFKGYFKKYRKISELIPDRVEAWRIVKTVADRAMIKKRIFPHVLRGTFASILAGKDFDALTIQAILGWKSVKTADEYIRISPQRLMKVIKNKW